jgi:hypothetical protein
MLSLPLIITAAAPLLVPIPAAEARKALLAWADQSQDAAVQAARPALIWGQVRFPGGDVIEVGPWRCYLAQRTFVLTLVGPGALFEVSGRFEQQKDGSWRVRVIRQVQT